MASDSLRLNVDNATLMESLGLQGDYIAFESFKARPDSQTIWIPFPLIQLIEHNP